MTEVNGQEAKLWLGGMNFREIKENTVLIADRNRDLNRVLLRSRDGLFGFGDIKGEITPGTSLWKK